MLSTRELVRVIAEALGVDTEALEWLARFAKEAGQMSQGRRGKAAAATARDAAVVLLLALARPQAHRVVDTITTVGGLTGPSRSSFLRDLETLITLRRDPDPRVADRAGAVAAIGVTEASGRLWPWIEPRSGPRQIYGDLLAYAERAGREIEVRIAASTCLAIATALGPRSIAEFERKDGASTEANAPSVGTNHRRATAGGHPRLATDARIQGRAATPSRQGESDPDSSRHGLSQDEDEEVWPTPSRTRAVS